MTESEIIKSQKRYMDYKEKQKNIIFQKQELEKIKQSPDVIKYIKLLEYENIKIPTDEEIISGSFGIYSICTSEDRKIYLYQGSYNSKKVTKLEIIPINRLNSTEQFFNIYINIETGKQKYINKNKIKEFEEENNVIYIFPEEHSETEEQYKKIYQQTKKQYFETLAYTSEKNAIKKIKELSKK